MSQTPENEELLHFVRKKYQLLMLYSTQLQFYILIKTEGYQAETHPVVNRLVEIKMILDQHEESDQALKKEVKKLRKICKQLSKIKAA